MVIKSEAAGLPHGTSNIVRRECFAHASTMQKSLPSQFRFPSLPAALFALATTSIGGFAQAPALTLKDNDVWVMAGDSITAQRQHTNYLEAFYQTRYPQMHLHFRNSGIGGNRTGNVLQRFDYDVAAWKPTIVSVELAMNDVGDGDDPAKYIKGMRELIAKIRALPAQPVLISSSPVDDGSMMNDWKSDRCRRLHPYTEALQKLAAEEKVVFVDQYHPLVDLWGKNRRAGAEEAAKKPASPASATPDAAAKPAPLAPSIIPLGGDPVHPGPVGQYTMASVILEGLKAPGEVSSSTLKADGSVIEAKQCKISEVSAKDGKLRFTRLGETSPWPILPAAKTAIQLRPAMLDLSRDIVRVAGLPEGNYRVTINGKPAATIAAKTLSEGWNLTTVFEGAMAERSTAILGLIGKLQGKLNNDWREASKAKDPEKLAAAQQAIEACEAELHTACQPTPLQFEIEIEKH